MKLRIKIDGKIYEAEVEILDAQESAPEYPPYPPAQTTFVSAALPEPAQIQAERNNDRECRSPVTGMVIKVNVKPGQEVQPEEVMVVLESMKMEMQITAPKGGLVKRVLVTSGSAVKADELMVEFA